MDRSSSEDGVDQLVFRQITQNKLLKEDLRVGGRGEAFQTKIRYRILHSLTPEKAF
jgi:hypothetical protein